MRNKKAFLLIVFGGFLALILQNFFLQPSFANNEKIINESEFTSNNDNVNFENAAEISVKAVVHIKSKYLEDEIYRYYDPFFGNRYFNNPREKVASGSGVIISENGYIITNMHVINDAKEIEVVLNDKRTFSAEILGTDPNSDLALLKINGKKLPYLKFANSNDLKIGQWVLAVGNPFNLSSTVTAGIISAKSREINILNDGGIEAFIQTDAAINPGNSGGALVNTDGDLIGINTAIHSNTGSYTGYGFAIPSNMVKKIIKDLQEFGEVKRAYIGIHILDLNAEIASELELDDANGVFIAKVLKNSAAEKVGIKSYDVITKINNRRINTVSQLNEIIIQFDPGDQIICTVLRDGEELDFNLSLQN
tara:strand:- start:1683 stop:2777 length:1095 start_codon:yes stop_codon:yes gene_type:complete